jgi:DNA adenine methylase
MADLSNRVLPPLKWHGGKHYLAEKIVARMPPRCNNPNKPDINDLGWLHYCEPYFGGGSVLLANDPDGISEVVNDIHGRLTNFWRVLQDENSFSRFARVLSAMPFSEAEWSLASESTNGADPVEDAIWFFVHCRQSLAGRMNDFAPLSRTRTRRGMNEQASAWLNAISGLANVHARLKRVSILNRDAVDVIRQQDGSRTLFYLDPPYLGETRTSDDVYSFEMGAKQHETLLETILACKGRVMLSGYRSDLYDWRLRDWTRHEFTLPNQAAGGKQKRRMVEVVWCNF